jgi:hypothetical protein
VSAVARLLIDEAIRADSSTVRTHLSLDGAHVRIEVDGGTSGALSAAAVAHVVRRYARPLDADLIPLLDDAPRLALPDGSALVLLHWRAAVDAAGRDWLVLMTSADEPHAALATGVAAALRYLVLRLQDER